MIFIAVVFYFSIVNVAAASLHFIDEVSTVHGGRGFRAPEPAHYLLAAMGGWLAAFAVQRALRRKPRTESFAPLFWLSAAANVAAVLGVAAVVS